MNLELFWSNFVAYCLQIGLLIVAGVVSASIAMVVIVRLPANYLSTLPESALCKVRVEGPSRRGARW